MEARAKSPHKNAIMFSSLLHDSKKNKRSNVSEMALLFLSLKLFPFYPSPINKQISSKRLLDLKLLFFLGNENDPVT